MFGRRRLGPYALALLLPLAAACSLSSSPSPAVTASTGGGRAQTTAAAGSTVNPGGSARDGGRLALSMAVDPLCLDPHAISSDVEQIFGRIQFDNLVDLDAAGKPSPWVAKSWDISADGLTYIFHLRDGITFSDGQPLDAAAVVVNLRHMLDPATRSPLAGPYIAPVRETTALDGSTVRVRLSSPYSPFLDVLAQGWLGLESPKAIRESTPAQLCEHPVASGPFVLTRYTKNQGATFDRRTDYDWGPPTLGHSGAPHLAGIDASWVGQDSVRYSSLVSGQFQATGYVPAQNAQQAQSDKNLVFENVDRIGLPATIEFNTSSAPFDDIRVRKAFAAAVDVPAVLRTIGFGQRTQPHGYLDAVTRGFDPSVPQTTFDAATANRLLDEAGWTGRTAAGIRTKAGKALMLSWPVGQAGTVSPLYDLVQAQAKSVGIDVRVELIPPAQLTTRRYSGDYDLLFGVWHTNTPDVLSIKYASSSVPTAERLGQNLAHLSDGQLDSLLAQGRQTTDSGKQDQLYRAAQHRLVDLVPGLPVYDNSVLWAVSSKLHDTLVDTSHGTPVFTYAWLDR